MTSPSAANVIMTYRNGTLIVRLGKNRRHREIPLHKEAREILKAYLKVRTDKDETLFMGQHGLLGERRFRTILEV
jgi:site-specific recombinase XerC